MSLLDRAKVDDSRKFGIAIVGNLPWGTHLCQFYQTKQDLIDILVPYFAEGLRSNEFCMWVTSPPLEVEEAKDALRKVVLDLDSYLHKGQIEIVGYDDWYLFDGKFDSARVLQGWVNKETDALKKGFEGLRLTGNTFWIERSLWQSFVDYEEAVNSVIGKHKMLALCTYSLAKCSGSDVLDVIRNHSGTLVRQIDRWYLVEDAARRKLVNGALEISERKYSALFENMQDGFAFHKLLVDDNGRPSDYVFLEVNSAFERLTGLRREAIIGKRVTEVLPGIEKDPADWIGVFGRVALTGERTRFQNYVETLRKWYKISAYSPEKEYFVTIFEDVTEGKQAEEALRKAEERLKKSQEIAHLGSWELDLKENKLMWSDEVYRIFGLRPQEFGATYEAFLSFVHPDDRAVVDAAYLSSLREGREGYEIEHRVVRKDNREIRVVHEKCSHTRDTCGKVVRSLGMVQDITERKKAEETLRNSEARYRSYIEVTGELGWTTNAEGEVVEDIPSWRKFTGQTFDAVKGSGWANALHPDDVGNTLKVWKQATQEKSKYEVEYRIRRSDGAYRHFMARGVPVFRDDGTISEWVGVCIEITERKRAEDELRKLKERFELAQHAAGVGVWYWDVTTGQVDWTSEMFSLFGLDRSSVSPSFEAWEAILHPEDRAKARSRIDDALKNHAFLDNEYRIVRPNGETIWINSLGQGEYDAQGLPLRMNGICIDITKRKKAEEDAVKLASFPKLNPNPVVEIDSGGGLRYLNPAAESMLPGLTESGSSHPFFDGWENVVRKFQEEKKESFSREVRVGDRWFYQLLYHVRETNNIRIYSLDIDSLKRVESELRETRDYLENLLNYANAPIIVWDPDFRIGRFNHAFEHLTGLNSKEVIGKHLEILFPKDKKDEAMAHILNTLAGEYWKSVEIPIRCTDGSVRTALWNSANVFDASGKRIVATIAQGQDITERKELEEKVKKSERMIGIGETAAMVGHDIRNPLQAILGYCSLAEELLTAETIDESQRRKLMDVCEQVKNQVQYTDKIVSDLRDYSSPVMPILVRTDLTQLIEEIVSTQSIPGNITVSISIPKSLHPIKTDASILRRVLTNLVTNAVQAMPNGGTLSLKAIRKRRPRTLVLSVQDTGVGIARSDRPRIFTPLFTTKARGQGLGLPVCKRLVEALDGTITFRSRHGKGSKFTFKIPLK